MTHFYLRIATADTVKVIISVSKKVAKKAVTRNLIKRRVRPIVHKLIPHLKPGAYMIVAKPGAQEIKGQALEKELRSLMMI